VTTHVVVIADGDGTRWGGYGGVPKHLARFGDETLLERTVRQFAGGDRIVWVVGPDDDRYQVPGSSLYVPEHNPLDFDADKFTCSRDLWNPDGRTLVVYGDVWFTDEAVSEILASDRTDWVLFGRAFGSRLTASPGGECFVQSFYPDSIPEHDAALRRVVRLYRNGLISRCGGWEHYRAMLRLPDSLMDRHLVGDRFVHIDDYTDDIDEPFQYDVLLAALVEAGLCAG